MSHISDEEKVEWLGGRGMSREDDIVGGYKDAEAWAREAGVGPTSGPWFVREGPNCRAIDIVGPGGEAVATLFPHAGKGGVGVEVARANAALIVRAVREGR